MSKFPSVLMSADLDAQHEWAQETFGPGPRVEGILAHMLSEIEEVRANPTDGYEWVDIIIMAIDGAMRNGLSGSDVIDYYHDKMRKNRKRVWPDWRTSDPNKPIEHLAEGDDE